MTDGTCLDIRGQQLNVNNLSVLNDASVIDSVGTGSITAAAITLQSGSVSCNLCGPVTMDGTYAAR